MTRTARAAPTDDRPSTPLTIVVGYDFSTQAELALEEGVSLGAASAPAELHVLGVLGHGGHGLGDSRPLHHFKFDEAEAMREKISLMVEAVLKRRGQAGMRAFVHCRIGEPAEQILALADDTRADLIVVGTHGRKGMERLLVGSVTEKVTRRAKCPVLTMRPTGYAPATAEAAAEAKMAPEPACPACVTRRDETGGAEWWCTAHNRSFIAPHRYAYTDNGITRMRPDEWVLW